ncbi:TIGR03564 family F420-dependent LLM class oxidoreductase [Streptomyces sp. S1D4-11]
MIDDVTWAERAGLDTAWVPQIPTDFDALTAVALMGARTERIEIGTAVVPLQTQHPIALARQALSAQGAANGRLALGLGPSHHWIVQDMLGLPYERPAAFTRDYLEVLVAALHGPGPVDVENGTFTVHNPLDLGPVAPLPVLVAALGPVMLALAGGQADGTVLWMADERAVADHVVPRITKAADGAGRPAPRIVAGIPVCLCLSPPRSTRRASGPTGSSGRRKCRPITSGSLTTATPGTSATCARPVTRRPSRPASGASPTPGSPICRYGCCRSARAARN